MTINTSDLINSIMESFDRIKFVKSADIPNIDLYMDQVTTFMDSQLKHTTRNMETDKILTKTMINNYAKNDLLPPPEKKKYSKEHVLILVFIYYFKNILSINDIQNLLNPLTDKYFGKSTGLSIEEIYNQVTDMEHYQVEALKKDILEKYEESQKEFQDVSAEEQEFLQTFSFICMLSFDVYVKKLLIETILDDYTKKNVKTADKNEKDKKAKTAKNDVKA